MIRRANTAIFVALESSDGIVGIGEALPRRYVTGEEPQDIVNTLRAPLKQLVGVEVQAAWELLPTLIVSLFETQGGLGASCALELACLDLVSKTAKTSIAELLQLDTPRSDTPSVTATLPLVPTWLLAPCTALLRCAGATEFKVKLTGTRPRDEGILRSVFAATRSTADIRVDLNMALSFRRALGYLDWLASTYEAVTWIEEPLTLEDRGRMPELKRHFGERFTFCGDEALCRHAELVRAIESGAYQAINVRVGKHGGLSAAVTMIRTAHDAGLSVQVGSLVGETAILSNSGALLAQHFPLVRYVEVGASPLLVRAAPVSGALTPSWGMTLNLHKLPRLGLARLHPRWTKRLGNVEESWCV
jgi:L-alanine-DL-glutamate epimerase-like enolase superfamily enzyme